MGSANMATRNDHSCGRNNGRNSNQQHSPQPASSRGRSRGRGRGSSFSSDSRPICQLCGKTGHIAPKCFHRFDLSYQDSSPNMPAYFTAPQNAADMNWYPDTGSTNHLTNDLQNLNLHVEPYNGHDNILVDDGTGLRIFNIGSSTIPYRTSSFHLRNLLHPLAIKNNLISVSQFTLDNDVFIEFHASYFVVKDEATGTILLHGKTRDGLYPFPSTKQLSKSLQSFLCHHVPLEVWHYRLGHPSYCTVQQIRSKHNLPVSTNKAPASCIVCQQGKSHRLPFSSSESKSTFPLELIFSDVWGPSPVLSTSGNKYYVSFVDHYSRYVWLFPISNKSDVLSIFCAFQNMVERMFDRKIIAVQIDWGSEFRSLHKFFVTKGIQHRLTCPHTSQQNGIVERRHRNIVEIGLSLLSHSSVPLKH